MHIYKRKQFWLLTKPISEQIWSGVLYEYLFSWVYSNVVFTARNGYCKLLVMVNLVNKCVIEP